MPRMASFCYLGNFGSGLKWPIVGGGHAGDVKKLIVIIYSFCAFFLVPPRTASSAILPAIGET